jgi:hypothetical protein
MMEYKPQHLPLIIARVLPHYLQNYDTAGDYIANGTGLWSVNVSKMSDWRHEALVLIHELVEMFTTTHNGISWNAITQFDVSHPELDDPGACPQAPYHKEHMAAEVIEKQLALLLGVDWEEYNKDLDSLEYKRCP